MTVGLGIRRRGHGLFTDALLRGLKGEAANKGEVTVNSLYVSQHRQANGWRAAATDDVRADDRAGGFDASRLKPPQCLWVGGYHRSGSGSGASATGPRGRRLHPCPRRASRWTRGCSLRLNNLTRPHVFQFDQIQTASVFPPKCQDRLSGLPGHSDQMPLPGSSVGCPPTRTPAP